MINENKHERFKRIAAKRTNEVLEKLRILGNCSHKGTYEYTEEDIEKIFSEINKQIKAVRAKFISEKSIQFKL